MLTDLIERRAAYVSADEDNEDSGEKDEDKDKNHDGVEGDAWEFETVKGFF